MGLLSIDKEKCKKDGICAGECPVGIIRLQDGDGYPQVIQGGEGACMTKCRGGLDMKRMRIFAVLVVFLLSMGCGASYKIHKAHSGYQAGVDFKGLKSYSWLYMHLAGNMGAYTMDSIKDAVYTQMKARGLTETQVNPDILIGAYAGREERVITRLMTSYGRGPGGYWRGEKFETYQYTEGTLILDLIDAKKRTLIWRGWATSDMSGELKPRKREKLVMDAVERILKSFPPK
jgi:hypothetical protein